MSNTSGWKELYEAAVLEPNQAEVEQRISECEQAIFDRLKQLGDNPNYLSERSDIETACAALIRLKSDTLGWPVIRLDDGAIMSATSRVTSCDIFCGETDGDAKWVETVEGLASAVKRMDTIALQNPGLYFVFDQRSRKVMARANSKHRYKPSASDAD